LQSGADVEHQQRYDRDRTGHQGMLMARMGAVLDAQRARTRHELGADSAFRQSLVDLAAIAELVAGDLPPSK